MSDSTSIPEGYKRCSNNSACAHPDGPILPATSEYFRIVKTPYKLWMQSRCRECERSYKRQWREKNPDSDRQWAKANPEKYRESRQRWRLANSEKVREYHREYSRRWRQTNAERHRQNSRKLYKKNLDRARAYARKYYALNHEKQKEKHRQYIKTNPDKHREYKQSRRARKRSLLSTFTAKDWQHALDYFGGCCAACGRPQGFWHILAQDHWIPLVKGGAYTPDNIIPLCHGIDGCNNSKRDSDPIEWLVRRFGKRKAKSIEKRILKYFDSLREAQDF